MRSSLVIKLACLVAFLLATALVQVVKSIDVERYRGVLASLSEQATGQTLDIRGRVTLRLSLSPRIEANDVVLPAAAGAAEPYQLTIGHLDADIALLPLLAGKVQIQKINAVGIHFLLERQGEGKSHWALQEILQVAEPKTDMPMTKLDLTQIEMQDVSVHLVDHKNIDQVIHFEQLALEADRPSGRIAVTAKGQWEGRQFDVSGVIGNLHDLADADKPFPIAMKAVLPGLVTTANGTLQRDKATDEQTVNLAITADAAEIGVAGRLFGISLPPLGAARVSFMLSGPPNTPHIADLELVFGRHDALAFSIKGAVADPWALKGVDVAITAEGENLPAFGRALDLALPAMGPVRLSAHLNDTPDGWHFTDIKSASRLNDLGGHLFLTRTEGRFSFDAVFESTKIDLGEFWGSVAETSADALPEGHIFSDTPLPFGLLAAADGSIAWNISHLVVAGLEMDDVRVPVTLRDGRLDAALTVGQVAGGHLEAALLLDSTQAPPLVTVNLTTDKVEAGPILAVLGGVTGIQGAPSDLHLSLSASGDNAHAIISKLAGEGSLAIGSGSFAGGLSIDEAPWLKDGRISLGCGYSHFTIEDGLAVTESIVLDLMPVTIGGRGSINFGREELDLIFVPRLKNSGQSDVLVPLDVGGTLRHPSLLPARGTVVKGVAPMLPPLLTANASNDSAGACEAAVMAKKSMPQHHLVHISTPSAVPGATN